MNFLLKLWFKTNKQTNVFLCPKCKQTGSSHERASIGNRVRKRASRLNLIILDKKDQNLKSLPTVNAQCPKCSGKIAETWTVTFGSEDNFQATYFRCLSCGHTVRQID